MDVAKESNKIKEEIQSSEQYLKFFDFLNKTLKEFKVDKKFDGIIPINRKGFVSAMGMDPEKINFAVVQEYLKILLDFRICEFYKSERKYDEDFKLSHPLSKIIWNEKSENCLFFVPTLNHLVFLEYQIEKHMEKIKSSWKER